MTDLGTLAGYPNSSAWGINNSGQVVGNACLTGQQTCHAFLYSGGAMSDLGSLGGGTLINLSALAINDSGQIVGTSDLADSSTTTHAFLYIGSVMYDLNALLASNAAGWVLNSANATKNAGQIVDSGSVNGLTHAFLLTPVIPLLTVNNANVKFGTVSSDVGGIVCGATCSANFASGSKVTLTAIPVSGYQFTG